MKIIDDMEIERLVREGVRSTNGQTQMHTDDAALVRAALSSALVPIFRGRFCDILLPNRDATTFDKDEVIYELGAEERTFFFIRRGVAKIGTITDGGREIIYDIRKDGDVLGELCALESPRRDRAVAMERTEAVPVAFDEVVDTLAKHPALLGDFLGLFCASLSEAYDQVNRLAVSGVLDRLARTLKALAHKLGRPFGRPGRDCGLSDTGRALADGSCTARKSLDGAQFPATARDFAVLAARSFGPRYASAGQLWLPEKNRLDCASASGVECYRGN